MVVQDLTGYERGFVLKPNGMIEKSPLSELESIAEKSQEARSAMVEYHPEMNRQQRREFKARLIKLSKKKR